MLRSLTLLFFTVLGVMINHITFAQDNIFPAIGAVGIGTLSPQQNLDVVGNAMARGNLISVISNPNIGGTLQLINPAKTVNGTASTWQIYNMGGVYGNSLQFWAYDNLSCVPGGMCANKFTIMDNGNVGIGVPNPLDKLGVNGNIRAKEVKVEAANWPDYVFESGYQLVTLQELEAFINKNKHLPEMPSAAQVKENGIELGEMNKLLLKKVEELTLLLIQKDKEIIAEKSTNEKQNLVISELDAKLNKIINKLN